MSETMINQQAPMFEHVEAYQKGHDNFVHISLKDYQGSWLVFFFYPRDFTFICPTELKGFAAKQEKFEEMNCKLLAASTDSAWSHKAWFERDLSDVTYPILADTTQDISWMYGVLNEQDGSAERGLFIIDPEGIVRYHLVSTGSVGRSVDETLRVLEALQTGDLCPMNWKSGEETLGSAS
jgi:alkyl hydroperoxide reductase subunit AhpC